MYKYKLPDPIKEGKAEKQRLKRLADKGKNTVTKTMVVATSVSAKVGGLKKKSSPLFKIVNNFKIKTVEDQAKMMKALKTLDAFEKEAKAEMGKFVTPAKTIIEQSKSFFKPFIDSVEEAKENGKAKVLAFVNSRLALSEKVGNDFKFGKVIKLSTVVTKQDELETNANTRNVCKLTIKKPNLIPRKYLVPDETLIREDLKKGKKIPGCVWKQETSISL